MCRLPLILFLLVCLAAVTTLSADGQTNENTDIARFQLAESYLRAGQFDRAISLLEQLYAADPTSFVYFDRLVAAFESTKRYDEALAIVERRVAEFPSPSLVSEQARITYLKGEEQQAFDLWQSAIDMAPAARSTYHVVYRSMLEVRLLDRATRVLVAARDRLGDPSAYRTDLASLFMMTGRFAEAVDEQLGLLEEDGRHLPTIIAALSRHAETPEAIEAAQRAATKAVKEDPLNRGFRELLSWIYLETGDYQGALNENRAIDRLEDQQGRVLLAFAERAATAGAFAAAESAYEEILSRYPEAPSAPHAVFGTGRLHEAWATELESDGAPSDEVAAHQRTALTAYRRFASDYRNHALYAQVLQKRGALELQSLRDLDAAENTLTEVTSRFEGSEEAAEARLYLGKIDLLRGDLAGAMIRFNRLVEERRIGDLAERARFEMARVYYYRGEFDAARTLLNALDVNTSTDVANDAVELKVIILTNSGPDSLNTPLTRFAEAQLMIRQHRDERALEALDALLAAFGNHGIADEARFARATLLRDIGAAEEALAAFREIPLFHPESHLSDRSLFEAALIQSRILDDAAGATETLTKLLTEYPGSLLLQDARREIRRIRGDIL
ncbi:MAG: tetratricopeptide repeat protein [Bacteroidota bacterium]